MLKEDIEYIVNVLRRGTVTWSGRAEVLRRCRKKVFVRVAKSGKKVYKFHWQCEGCREWFRDQRDLEVDHVVEIGGFKGDWNEFISRMYSRIKASMQALCLVCHKRKTAAYMNAKMRYTRKPRT